VIKNLKIELILIVAITIIVFIVGRAEYKVLNTFLTFINSETDVYFKQFFVKITVVGDSFWVFLSSSLVCFYCFFFKKNDIFFKKIFVNSSFLFSATLITGLLTQIIKHLVGRARPNHSASEFFNFFNFDSIFHSFPSGHTSTIFLVALVFSMFTPKLKYFYFCCAGVIGLSRVIVGAHFLTDIMGGAILAYIGYKITLSFFNKIKIKKNFGEIITLNSNNFFLTLIVFFILIGFLTVGSSLDIFLSSLFYGENEKFILQRYSLPTIFVRQIILPMILLYLFFIPCLGLMLPLKKFYFNFNLKNKEVLFVFTAALFNLLIVVNVIFKNTWGRARPNDVLQLGGSEAFTPWFQTSDSCVSNCSFVSGDASVGFSIISLFFITKKPIYLWLSIFFGLLLGAIRILEGGHFLSDVLVAGFLIFILTYLEFYFYNKTFSTNAY
jgi:lipid A 4'-phosphatase